MDKQFTASEVRESAIAVVARDMEYDAEMLRAFADMLEAREKAVPVRQFRVVPKGSTWTDVKDDEIWAAVTAHPESYETRVLYTHSAQAQPTVASVTDGFLRHVAAVCMGAVENCRPKALLIPEDPQEHNGGLCLNELTHIAGEIDRMLAAQENPNG